MKHALQPLSKPSSVKRAASRRGAAARVNLLLSPASQTLQPSKLEKALELGLLPRS